MLKEDIKRNVNDLKEKTHIDALTVYLDITLEESVKLLESCEKSRVNTKIAECYHLNVDLPLDIFFYPYGRLEIFSNMEMSVYLASFLNYLSSILGRRIDVLAKGIFKDGKYEFESIHGIATFYLIIKKEITEITNIILHEKSIKNEFFEEYFVYLVGDYLEELIYQNEIDGEGSRILGLKVDYEKKEKLLNQVVNLNIKGEENVKTSTRAIMQSIFRKGYLGLSWREMAYAIVAAAIWESICKPIIIHIIASWELTSVPVVKLKGKYPEIDLLLNHKNISLQTMTDMLKKPPYIIMLNMNFLEKRGVVSQNRDGESITFTLASNEMLFIRGDSNRGSDINEIYTTRYIEIVNEFFYQNLKLKEENNV